MDKSKAESLRQELEKIAVRYLARYSASEATLKTTLIKNLSRRGYLSNSTFDNKDIDPHLNSLLEDIIVRFRKQGALNDKNYAETKFLIYRRMGRSRHIIQQLLLKKGIDQTVIKTIMAFENERADNSDKQEFEAALIFAKRRRLGPYQKQNAKINDPRKDIGKLMRAGFSIEIARQVMRFKAL
jgi:regulatory protein